MAASAVLGLAISSSASAQPTREEYCSDVAWYNCSWVNGQPTIVTVECYYAEYDACMAGTLAANAPPAGDKRLEVELASRPVAAPRL